MHHIATASQALRSDSGQDKLTALEDSIHHAAHLLPSQGPITAFVHHNTLHQFEHLPFTQALPLASRLYGCMCYLPEGQYRQKLASGRIRISDLGAILEEECGETTGQSVLGLCTRFQLRMAMLRYPLRLASSAELEWVVAETDALHRFRDDAPPGVRDRLVEETRHWIMRDVRNGGSAKLNPDVLANIQKVLGAFDASSIEDWDEATWEAFSLHLLWRACRQGVRSVPPMESPRPYLRHRDLLLEATGDDPDRRVNELLIRFCSAFLDQGYATWPLAGRDAGFFACFSELYRLPAGPPTRWLAGLAAELQRIHDAGLSPLQSIDESLTLLGVPVEERDDYLAQELLALRGWAGMIWQTETNPDRIVRPTPEGSLTEYLAVRLILSRFAVRHAAKTHLGYTGPLDELSAFLRSQLDKQERSPDEQRAFLVFQLAQLLGWKPETLLHFDAAKWSELVEQIESFHALERRRVYQIAMERKYRNQTLDALAVQSKRKVGPFGPPRFQASFCIDDREESFRRHLEEVAPDAETFAVAGFYGVAMYYRGAADAHFMPLCPVVVKPKHYIQEEVVYSLESSHRKRAKTRRIIGHASHQVHIGSRSFIGGILVAMLGSLASIPLVARVLFPRLAARIKDLFSAFVGPPPVTELALERLESDPATNNGCSGYTLEEMGDISERVLRDLGLVEGFARLVVFVGHGSDSVNNPHKAAYDCGACGGGPGGPNARALAQMLNKPLIRRVLAERGIHVPHETYFIGAHHNTCDDSVTFFDLDRLPKSHRRDFTLVEQNFQEASNRNAHERCRRFVSAPLNLTFEEARKHVEKRSEDLAQARPECGHATNAVCVVGRRFRTRGLFMDRRAFLTSYDPTKDPDGSILARILAPVIPVCAGIGLEYYFSYVDPAGWGCGTKLPHNVVSLLGVMDGAASDLRPGLPWQMTEIHEPLRLLFVIETTPEVLTRILDENESLAQLCRNDWVQVATMDPETSELRILHNGRFELYHPEVDELPMVGSSTEWYRGWRDHLDFCLIRDEPLSVVHSQSPALKESA